MNDGDVLLSLTEAARVLGCTDAVLRVWIKSGRLRQVPHQGIAQVTLGSLRGLPKKRVFSDRDVERVARRRRIGRQSPMLLKAAG